MKRDEQVRRLTRDPENGVVAGVCAGLGEYLGADAVLVRLGFALGALLNGLGLVVYVLCWILIPRRDLPEGAASSSPAAEPSGPAAAPGAAAAAPADRIVEEVREAGQKVRQAGERVIGELGREAPQLGGSRVVAGIVLILVGAVFLLRRYDLFDWWDWSVLGRLWPVLLILIGLAIVFDALRDRAR